jgi:hypothetical protein
LFDQVEQVVEDAEPTVLASRLHQRGEVAGRSLESLWVCFPGNQVISVRAQLLYVLDEVGGGQ